MKHHINFTKLNLIILMFITFANNAFSTNPPKQFTDKDPVSYIVYFTGDMASALEDNDQYLKTFIEVYELEVVKKFDNEGMKGFILVAPFGTYEPLDLAKEISLIEDVMMVELEDTDKIKIES